MTEVSPHQTDELSNEKFFGTLGEMLSLEWQRKNSLEQRGISVITTSGVLVTLVFAGTTLVSQGKQYASLIRQESEPIIVALSLFVIAALLGLMCNLPLFYRAIGGKRMIEIYESPATRNVELLNAEIEVLRAARRWNSLKSWLLAAAMAAEVAAIVFLVQAVSYIVANS